MSTYKGKPSSNLKLRPSNIESEEEEARLDALIPARPAPSTNNSTLPSKLDTTRKGTLPSRLDATLKSSLPSRLDSTRRDNLLSKLDKTSKSTLSSKLDSTRNDNLPSKLDGSSNAVKISTKTAFTSQRDIEMATRQTKYDQLPPKEQEVQEEWAQRKIAETAPCIAGFLWLRVPGGYNCTAGLHWMTDDQLAEGRGGFYGRNPRAYGLDLQQWMDNGGSPLGLKEYDRAIGFSRGMDGFVGPFESKNLMGLRPHHPQFFNQGGISGFQRRPGRQDGGDWHDSYNNPYNPFGYPPQGSGFGGRFPPRR